MTRDALEIIQNIRKFNPISGNWQPLEGLFHELWTTGAASQHIIELLGVLERFPEDDGAGVLWSIVHGIESIPGYEPDLVRSVRRVPSSLGVAMIGRLLNAGVSQVDDVSLFGVLREVESSAYAAEEVRSLAIRLSRKHAPPGMSPSPNSIS